MSEQNDEGRGKNSHYCLYLPLATKCSRFILLKKDCVK